jgi:hypothetical protein
MIDCLKENEMNVKEEVKTEERRPNENSPTDLPVADEQSEATKGGGAAIGLILGGPAGTGAR